ncbi:MAG: glycosyltransferase family 9 protein [Ignavibacteria bacterium]
MKVLVFQIGKIGDTILTTPLFANLKKFFPESEVIVLCSPFNKDIISVDPYVDNFLVYDKKVTSTLKILLKLRLTHFDYWIDIKNEYSSTSTYFLKICNPQLSLGFNVGKYVFDINLFDFITGYHYIDYATAPFSFLLKEKSTKDELIRRPYFIIPESIQGKYNHLRKKNPIVLLNLSTDSFARRWSFRNWKELIEYLSDREFDIILTSLPDEKPQWIELLEETKYSNVYYVDAITIFEFAELIKTVDILISPDTSAIHIASCFNKPVVSLYNNVQWNINKFAPLSNHHIILKSKERNSINSISPHDVLESFSKLAQEITLNKKI